MKYATGSSKNRSASHSALRIGIVQNGHLIEERKLADCARVTLGQSPRNVFTLSAPGLPRTYPLFRREGGRQVLRFAPRSEGRVTVDGRPRTLDQACAEGAARREGDWYELTLEPEARGKLCLGEVTVLFQQIQVAPVVPQPRLPASLQGGIAHRMDPVFTRVLSGSLALAAAFLIAVQLVPKPSGALRSSRIKSLLGNRTPVQQSTATPPKPGAVAQSQQPGQTDGEPSAEPSETTPTTSRHRNADPGGRTPVSPVKRGTAAYAALMKDLTNIQVGDDRMAAIAIAGQCRTPAECARAAAGSDELRNGAGIGRDLDDRAQRAGGIGSTRPQGPSSHTRRPGLAYNGGRPAVTGIRTDPSAATSPRPRPRPRTLRAPQAGHIFRPPPVRAKGGASISAKVRRRVYSLRYCYNRLLPSHPTLKGAVKISFVVLPNGRVKSVNISTGMGGAMQSCVQGKVARWTLGKPKITGPVYYGPFYVRFYPRN